MLEQDMVARVRAAIEDELGSFRAFADLPATDLEMMAERITRTIAPMIAQGPHHEAEPAVVRVRESRAA